MADAKVDGRRTFASGAKVRIIGLDSRPELNGILGEVVGPLDAGRYPVSFLSGGGGAKVKMENLRIGVRAKPKLYPGYESLLAMARAHDFTFLRQFLTCLPTPAVADAQWCGWSSEHQN